MKSEKREQDIQGDQPDERELTRQSNMCATQELMKLPNFEMIKFFKNRMIWQKV